MILLNPGPANTTASVKAAMTREDVCPRERSFGEVMFRVRDDLTRVVHGEGRYQTVLFGGSGTASVEAVICSVVPPAGRLLIVENGAYGKRIGEIATAYGIPHDTLSFGVGGYPDLAQVEQALDRTSYTHLAVIHHETSSGMLNPVSEIGAFCKARGVEMIVDAMSSYAGVPIDIEAMGATYLVSSSNKCIQGMAGLSFVICEKSALERLEPVAGRSLYLNLALQHRFFDVSGQMRYTPPVQVVYALEQALEEFYLEDGGEGRYRRYRENFEALHQGMVDLGFRSLLPETQFSHILTAYIEPDHENYSFEAFHDRLFDKGFTIYPGKGADQATFRLANMGAVTADDMRSFILALKETLSEMAIDPLYRDASLDRNEEKN